MLQKFNSKNSGIKIDRGGKLLSREETTVFGSNKTLIRLTPTRDEKATLGMYPRLNRLGLCLIVLAERNLLSYDKSLAIRVITSSQRRNSPQFSHLQIDYNNLLTKTQANVAGVDSSELLNNPSFMTELNNKNPFVVKNGRVFTPFADACLHDITRGLIIDICPALNFFQKWTFTTQTNYLRVAQWMN